MRGQIKALLGFAEVSVFALSGNGSGFDPRIRSWQASTDVNVSKPLGVLAGMSALRTCGHPFEARFSQETASELRGQIRRHRPDYIILSRIDLTVYLSVIREVFDGVLVLDLDESIASTGPSTLKLMKHPGQALVFKAFCQQVELVEKDILGTVDQIWVSSEVERTKLIGRYRQDEVPASRVSVMPNCIAVGAYSRGSSVVRSTDTIIYPASFAHPPNLDAARFLVEEVMPLLPHTKLKFVGSHIPGWMREIDSKNISCDGAVKDVVPYLQEASALVIPLRAGGGTRLKAIESLAAGLPIVSTAFGVEGLGLVPGRDYLAAETPLEFARHCTEIASNGELATELAERGRKTATSRFSTDFLETRMRGVMTESARRNTSP